ncbi:hypothetical protein KBD33_05180 [Candidatus Gracilibacteria bacterium]|nr:hypothetical protein [Candidatus Gracilibacteria bacterium]
MKIKYFTYFILFFLVSCSGSHEEKGQVPPISQERNREEQNREDSTPDLDSGIKQSSGAIAMKRGEVISGTLEKVRDISTLDDLKGQFPALSEIPGSDHPQFVELQKSQIALGLLLSSIDNKEYISLRDELSDIYTCKDIWTDEMKSMEIEFREAIKNPRKTNTGGQDDFKMLLDKRNKLMQEFLVSAKCRDSLQLKNSRIEELNSAMKIYYTPEMLELQKQVDRLSAEVYKSEIK